MSARERERESEKAGERVGSLGSVLENLRDLQHELEALGCVVNPGADYDKPKSVRVVVSRVGCAVVEAQLSSGEAWPVALLDRVLDLFVLLNVELAQLDRPGIKLDDLREAGFGESYDEYAALRAYVEQLVMAGALAMGEKARGRQGEGERGRQGAGKQGGGERALTVSENLVVLAKAGYVKIVQPGEPPGVDDVVYVDSEEIPALAEVLLKVYQMDVIRDSSLRSE